MGDTSNVNASASQPSPMTASTYGGPGGTTTAPAAASTPSNTNYGGMGLTAAGGLASAYGTYTAAMTNRRIAGMNAQLAGMQADQAVQAGQYTSEQAIARGRLVAGAARAAQAGSGTVAGAGTGAAVLSTTGAAAASDAQMIRLNAIREAYGYQVKQAGEEWRGDLDKLQAETGTASVALQTGSQLALESDPNYAGFRGRGMSFSGM